MRISISEVKTFIRCKRQHKHTYIDGYKLVEAAKPLEFGTSAHKFLDQWKVSKDLLQSLSHIKLTDPYEQILCEELMTGYHARWVDQRASTVATEQWFETPLTDPITGAPHPEIVLVGKIDWITEIDGRLLISEHKTSSSDIRAGSHYWQKLVLDSQISIYWHGARSLGYEPYGCLYDVIGKPPKVEPRLATPEENRKYTKAGVLYANQRAEDEPLEEYRARVREQIMSDPDRYYARAVVPRLERELQESAQDLWETAEEMLRAKKSGQHPRNVDSCFTFGRVCEFHPVCSGTGTLEDPKYRKRLA